MKTSEQTNELFAALAKAQGEMKNPEKNKTATIPTKTGGKYSYNYADLPVTYDCARDALSKNGLAHFSSVSVGEHGIALQMRLTHSSGQWVESEMPLPDTPDPKVMAANLTYFRRYMFTALVGVAADEDLDSEPEDENAKYTNRTQSQQPETPAPQIRNVTTVSRPAVAPKTGNQWGNGGSRI